MDPKIPQNRLDKLEQLLKLILRGSSDPKEYRGIIHPNYIYNPDRTLPATLNLPPDVMAKHSRDGPEGFAYRQGKNVNFNQILDYKILSIGQGVQDVWFEIEVEAKHTGTYYGIPPTNKTYSFTIFGRYVFQDNMIISGSILSDNLKILTSIGRAIVLEDDAKKIESYLESLKQIGIYPI